MRRPVVIGAAVALAAVLAVPSAASRTDGTFRWNSWLPGAASAPAAQPVAPGVATLKTVPPAHCRPTDKPETGLQGQVPLADRASGRAAEGYSCNLTMVGGYKDFAFTSLDSYGDCAYFGDAFTSGGVVVLDVRNPAKPVRTAYLTTPAMQNPWESLRVNAARGLLVADHNYSPALDVYDVKTDCRHPRLLASINVPGGAMGHEGWFSPDGRTWWMTNGTVPGLMAAIDLTDPRKPTVLGLWNKVVAPHGGSTTADGTRTYVCQQSNYSPQDTAPDAVVVLDTSQVQARAKDPQTPFVAVLPFADTTWCQATYHVTYKGRPYLLQYGERTPLDHTRCADARTVQYAYPRIIDISDEREPKVVSSLLLEVDDPVNCAATAADVNVLNAGRDAADRDARRSTAQSFHYDVHHCSPDRLTDPTLLACSYFDGGLRVFDIANPAAPRELATYNVGTVSATDPTIDMAISRPVIRAAKGEVWWTTTLGGFHVAKLAPGLLPRGALTCSARPDWYFDQYNPGRCRR